MQFLNDKVDSFCPSKFSSPSRCCCIRTFESEVQLLGLKSGGGVRRERNLSTMMACCTSVLQCSHMFFKILLAALCRAVVVDLEATVSG